MCEEVGQLWDQELRYRPGFDIIQNKVMMPVLAAKICGVKDKEVEGYWKQIRKLCTAETLVITQPGWFQKGDSFMGETPKMIANGRVDKKRVKGKPILCVCDLKGRGSGLYPGKNRGGNPAEANLRHI